MGGLADLLMGVAGRAAEVNRRNEQRAYNEASQGRQLANEAIMEKLKDPTLSYEEQQRYAGVLEDNNKMKRGSLSTIFDKAHQLHPHLEKLVGQGQQPMPPIPTMGADKTYSATPSSTMQFEPPITVQGGGLRGQQAPAIAQPNVQMQTLPQFQQLAPMPQPPVGVNPRGVAQTTGGQSETANAPRSEMERIQQAHNESLQRHITDLKTLGASPETIADTIRASSGLSSAAQAAQIGAQSRENVAKINATARMLAAGNNSGHFVTVQEPGEIVPKTVFQIEKGSHAGTMVEPNTMEPAQLKPGYKKLFDHPDKLSLETDKDGNVRVVNQTQGKVTSELGPIGKPASAANAGELTPEGLDIAAESFAKTGQLPAMGMGAAGVRTKIINRAAELHPKVDLASNKAAYTANQASLTQMQKNRDAVVTWEGTALKNLKIFEEAAKPIIDSGSPLLNMPLRLAAQKAVGSKEIAAFNTARTVALTEIAKVLNNPNLTGQLTNEAREEAMALAPATATLGQIASVVGILKRDMKNRHDELDATVQAIKDRIGGKEPATGPSLGEIPKQYPFRVSLTANGMTKTVDVKDEAAWERIKATKLPVKVIGQ